MTLERSLRSYYIYDKGLCEITISDLVIENKW